jgi:hypothetical protein
MEGVGDKDETMKEMQIEGSGNYTNGEQIGLKFRST